MPRGRGREEGLARGVGEGPPAEDLGRTQEGAARQKAKEYCQGKRFHRQKKQGVISGVKCFIGITEKEE